MIHIAWQKKAVHYNNTRYFIDHDYPSTILKKCLEYEVKKVLRELKNKFQAPYLGKNHGSIMTRASRFIRVQWRPQKSGTI